MYNEDTITIYYKRRKKNYVSMYGTVVHVIRCAISFGHTSACFSIHNNSNSDNDNNNNNNSGQWVGI